MSPAKQQLSRLRKTIAKSETLVDETRVLPIGIAEIDAALGGGLNCGTLHELSAAAATHLGAAAGFALSLAVRSQERAKETLWIATDFGTHATGALYGPGLDLIGLDTRRLLNARVPRPVDALFAMEDALKCRALSCVIAEMTEDADLTATRRLSLAAREGGALALLLRHKATSAPTVAMTRWQVASAPSQPDEFGGLGLTAFSLTLTRNRRGICGAWTITWDHHEHAYAPLSLGVAEAASDRQDRKPQEHTG
jgi:protein ImuA